MHSLRISLVVLGVFLSHAAAAAAPAAEGEPSEMEALRASVAASAKDPALSFALGRAFHRAGRFSEARIELNRGLNLQAPVEVKDGFRYEIARTWISERDLPKALATCAQMSAKDLASACRAESHLLQNRAAEALPEIEKALRKNPKLYEALVALGRANALQGKADAAEANFGEAVRVDSARAEAHYHRGLLLLAHERRSEGIEALRLASKRSPGDPLVAYELGRALGPTREALELLEKAVSARKNFAEAYAVLADVATQLGELARADEASASALAIDRHSFAGHLALGRLRLVQDRFNDAIVEAETAKKLLANAASVDLLLGDAYAGRGDVDFAVQAYQNAFGMNRSDASALIHAGNACIKFQRLTTARGFAERATREFANFAPAWVLLGDVFAAEGNMRGARESYERALKSEGLLDRALVEKKAIAIR